MAKDVLIDGRVVTLQIWDTAGQEKFQSLGGAFYRGADCCALVYDITSPKSFESLDSWRDEFLSQGSPKDPENFPFVVLGNKADKESERKVSNVKALQWCKNHGNIEHFDTSAKDNVNVEQAFQAIARAAASRNKEEEIFFPPPATLNKNKLSNANDKKQGCCQGGPVLLAEVDNPIMILSSNKVQLLCYCSQYILEAFVCAYLEHLYLFIEVHG
eukprot:TRINITY_DN1022_c0_g2_i8.p1 TRINITY_DN1022_c0_g2~~TRINITY_DN1022_c0_g2_i8.p1  ORF type:complete len:215 (-),score=63.24 TRINITY_DN1022_c0_g2_i8:226-870(-)